MHHSSGGYAPSSAVKLHFLSGVRKPAPAPDSEPDNMVYLPGFGWIESQGPNHAEYAEDMYENGNKIGIMG